MTPPHRSLLQRWHVAVLLRIACYATLVALSLMVLSVLDPTALPIIVAMSVGHGLGAFAFVCYVLAVLTDTARRPPSTDGVDDADSKPIEK